MDKENCFNLGQVIRVHGIRGEVVVYISAPNPALFLSAKGFYLEDKSSCFTYYKTSNWRLIKPGRVLLKIEGINSIDEAEKIKGFRVWLPLQSLPVLNDKEFYFHEIIGFTLIDVNIGEVGIITDVFDIPSNTIIQVIKEGKEILIPAAKKLINNINRAEKKMNMNLPEGLLDIYLHDES